jgi:cell division protein FtsN
MTSPRKHQRPPTFNRLFIVFILGAAAGGAGVYTYLPESLLSNKTDVGTTKPCDESACAALANKQETQPVRGAEDFDFYAKLENAEIESVPAQEAPPTVSPPTGSLAGAVATPATPKNAASVPPKVAGPADSATWYLQVASLSKAEEADALKARLSLAGVAVEVVNIELPEIGMRYRVRVGPYSSKEQAVEARVNLTTAYAGAEKAILTR